VYTFLGKSQKVAVVAGAVAGAVAVDIRTGKKAAPANMDVGAALLAMGRRRTSTPGQGDCMF